MLELWRETATESTIRAIPADAPPADRIMALARLAAKRPSPAYGGLAAEPAIRDWGRYDDEVRVFIADVDRRRLAFTTELFSQLGLDAGTARMRAALFYAAYVGMTHLEAAGMRENALDLAAFARFVTAKESSGVKRVLGSE